MKYRSTLMLFGLFMYVVSASAQSDDLEVSEKLCREWKQSEVVDHETGERLKTEKEAIRVVLNTDGTFVQWLGENKMEGRWRYQSDGARLFLKVEVYNEQVIESKAQRTYEWIVVSVSENKMEWVRQDRDRLSRFVFAGTNE
ncbi:MAG: hypothetical protein KDD36_08375 [Flavobacteriales bacterium]|nr:hypothetical protein [Flavobacteriales bacterium]